MIIQLSELIPQLLHNLKLEEPLHGWKAVQEWPQVVGERLARRTRAVRYREGKLWVEVEGSVWMQELSLLKPELMHRLGRHLAGPWIKDLVFTLRRGGNQR